MQISHVTCSEEAVQRHPDVARYIEFQIILSSKVCTNSHHKNGYENENPKPVANNIVYKRVTSNAQRNHLLLAEKICISGHSDNIRQILEHLNHGHVSIHQTMPQKRQHQITITLNCNYTYRVPKKPAAQHADEEDIDRQPLQGHSGVEIRKINVI